MRRAGHYGSTLQPAFYSEFQEIGKILLDKGTEVNFAGP